MAARLSASSSLRTFLAAANSTLRKSIASQEKLNFVIGNESADLDSITSSILFAYLRSQSPGNSSLYIPLLNIPRRDVRIRPELLALLPHANLEPEHLITLDDLPPADQLPSSLPPENTRWCLVDHNALTGTLGQIYHARVAGCIDHHKDEGMVPQNAGAEPRIIKTAGSCCSLVVNHFRDVWQSLAQASSLSSAAQPQSDAVAGTDDAAVRRLWDAQVAKLALASILIDTRDLKSKDKVTVDDEDATKFLEATIHIAPPPNTTFDRHAFFEEINQAKLNFQGMSLQEILRKDYKQWTENEVILGISSVPKELAVLLNTCKDGDSVKSELKAFAQSRDLDVFAVMTAFSSSSGEFQRQLLLFAASDSGQGMLGKIPSSANTELGLEPLESFPFENLGPSLSVFRQHEVDKSRKQVGPLLREAIKS